MLMDLGKDQVMLYQKENGDIRVKSGGFNDLMEEMNVAGSFILY